MERALLHVSEELLRGVEARVSQRAQPIVGEALGRTGYVDGSNVLDERRSVHLAMFSVASVILSGGRLSALARGASQPVVSIIVPKSYGEQRANLYMSLIELLAARRVLDAGVDSVFLDGSLVSEIMVIFSHPRDVVEKLRRERGEWLDLFPGHALEKVSLEVEDLTPGPIARLLREISEKAWQLYNMRASGGEAGATRKNLLDFAYVYVETTVYLEALKRLLLMSRDLGVPVFWVAKDSETSSLVEAEGLEGWLNDVTLLDYAWRDLEDAYMTIKGNKFGDPRPCAANYTLVQELFREWGNYSISYFKLRKMGPVLQMTYPEHVGEDQVLSALATLKEVSESRGYPKPLSYVHHLAVLNPEVARLVADEIYRRTEDSIVRAAYAPTGRAKAGLR